MSAFTKLRERLNLERTTTLGESASPSPLLSAACERSREPLLAQKPSYSRRALTRLLASEDIWVCWRCNGRDDVSRVLDISIDGLFIQTPHLKVKEGMPAKLDFLVQEGRIKADAVVRHVKGGSGLGLRFVAVAEEDRQRLKALLSRLRSQHAKPPSPPFRPLEQD
jgi:hypothetical protein